MYTYNMLVDDITFLHRRKIRCGSIGKSELGKNIYCVHLGQHSSTNQIIVTAAIHAREHISTLLLMKTIFYLVSCSPQLCGGIYFVPMLNPDGCQLCCEGIGSVDASLHEKLIGLNGGKSDFSLWKANIRGVDLNTNFDANFGSGKSNVFAPAPQNYVGEKPFSESETIAIRDFTLKIKPAATISYHAKGHELYWEFFQQGDTRQRDLMFADYVNSFIGYKRLDGSQDSAGGYKDWCIKQLGIPSLTIELVDDSHPHPLFDDALINEDYYAHRALLPNVLGYLQKING